MNAETEALPHPSPLPTEREKDNLTDIGAALLDWFDDGHPCITGEALARWAGVAPWMLLSAGFIEVIPAAELVPGAQGEFYRLASGFRERWEHLQHG